MSYNWLKKSFWHFVNMERLKYYFISFTENSDAVYCFYCGIGLKEWKEGDTPWGEHAKWSPDCVFVRNIKGPDFIETERRKESDPKEVNMLQFFSYSIRPLKKCLLSFSILMIKIPYSYLNTWTFMFWQPLFSKFRIYFSWEIHFSWIKSCWN